MLAVHAYGAIFIIAVAILATGMSLRRLLGRTRTDWLAEGMLALLLGSCVLGWVALVLAEYGWFSLAAMVFFAIVIAIEPFLRRDKVEQTVRVANETSEVVTDAPIIAGRRLPLNYLLLFWLPVAVILFFRPHQFVYGGADAGVYVSIGANIAQTGRLLIEDQTLAELDVALYPWLLREAPEHEIEPYLYFPGFYMETVGTGEITPQFYPLHPVWQAVAYTLGGVSAELLITGMWALFAVLAVFMTVRDLDHGWARWLLLGGMTLNALQIWFARYPTTEPLAQFLVWGGLWAFARMLASAGQDNEHVYAVVAALSFGMGMLTRIDLFPLLLIPPAWGVLTWLRPTPFRLPRAFWWFNIPFVGLAIHTYLHAWLQSRPYLLGLFGFEIAVTSGRTFGLLGVLFIGGVVALLVVKRFMARVALRDRAWWWARLAAIVVVLGFTAWNWFVRPIESEIGYLDWYSGVNLTAWDHENLLRLGWYVSPLGVWLGALGACWLIWTLKPRTALLVAVGLLFSFLFIWRVRANYAQIYAMRRYVPVVMPALLLSGSLLLEQGLIHARRELRILSALAGVLWLVGFVWLARGFVTQVDQVGLPDQIAALSAQVEPNAILIFNAPEPVGPGDVIGTPLRFLHGHDVYTLRETDGLDLARFAAQIERWQSAERSVYWVEVEQPTVNPWPLDPIDLTNPQRYTLQFSQLEAHLERKPTEIWDIVWAGTIYEVTQRGTE